MEAFYILLFAAIAATTVFFELGKGRAAGGSSSSSSSSSSLLTRDFVAFRNNYVLVYALMMGELLWFFIQLVVNGRLGIELRLALKGGDEKARKKAGRGPRTVERKKKKKARQFLFASSINVFSSFRRLSSARDGSHLSQRLRKDEEHSREMCNRPRERLPRGTRPVLETPFFSTVSPNKRKKGGEKFKRRRRRRRGQQRSSTSTLARLPSFLY